VLGKETIRLAVFPLFRVTINLQEFGGASLKPLWIYSQFEWIKELLDYKTHPFTKGKKRPAAKKEVSVNKEILSGLFLKRTKHTYKLTHK